MFPLVEVRFPDEKEAAEVEKQGFARPRLFAGLVFDFRLEASSLRVLIPCLCSCNNIGSARFAAE